MFLQEKVPYNGEIEHLGLSTLGHFSTFVGAIRSNLFLPQRQAKKGYPLLSPILSATYHFSTFNYVFNKKHCTINHLHFLLGGKSFFCQKFPAVKSVAVIIKIPSISATVSRTILWGAFGQTTIFQLIAKAYTQFN